MSLFVSNRMRNVMTSYPIDPDTDMPELPSGYSWAMGNCDTLGTKQLELRRSYSVAQRRWFREPVVQNCYEVVTSWYADNPLASMSPQENLQYFAYMILTFRSEAMYIKFEGTMSSDVSKDY